MKYIAEFMGAWSAVALTFAAAQAVPLKQAAGVVASALSPHRAVYEITLADRKDGVTVSDVVGRMVFELTGSSCEGYTQNIRLVTRIIDEEGKQTVSDLRSSTWEKGNGERFRFTSSHYFNDNLQEMVSGTAVRNKQKSTVTIRLKQPSETALSIAGDVLFPTQHSLALLLSAQKGERMMRTKIYDGSEQGRIVYQTVAFIGAAKAADPTETGVPVEDKNKDRVDDLRKHASWPVAISYFDETGRGDTTPSYELSFRLYPNGVSRNLLINYGDFSVRGTLGKLTYLHAASCK